MSRQLHRNLLSDPDLSNAHVGVSVIDLRDSQVLVSYQSDKYFLPASNTKLFTCYAGMKYLGDSITGIEYSEDDTAIFLHATGDPTFLHPDFPDQPVVRFLQTTNKPLYITEANWNDEPLGSGWSWDDYNAYYMPERSPLPVYGNVIRWVQERDTSAPPTENILDQPVFTYSLPEVNWPVRFTAELDKKGFLVARDRMQNFFRITQGLEPLKKQDVPFITDGLASALELLPDTIGHKITLLDKSEARYSNMRTVYSRPTDSLLALMMRESDNLFAEQVLLMISNERYGEMKQAMIIDSLLANDLKDLPQRPRWVDGSGLSRLNLFSPNDMITVLTMMRRDFGMERIQRLLATGGRGTLLKFYKSDSNYIFAKTGTLSGVVTLSGFLYTRRNKLFCFSVLVNNHRGNAVAIRRKVESFLTAIRQKY